jgi:hypothetical protein
MMDSGDADGQIWDDSLFLWHQVSLNIISSLSLTRLNLNYFYEMVKGSVQFCENAEKGLP